jgi:hypothetical protein
VPTLTTIPESRPLAVLHEVDSGERSLDAWADAAASATSKCPAKTSGSLARPAGLEPATGDLEGRCSIQLSYGRVPEVSTTYCMRCAASTASRNHGVTNCTVFACGTGRHGRTRASSARQPDVEALQVLLREKIVPQVCVTLRYERRAVTEHERELLKRAVGEHPLARERVACRLEPPARIARRWSFALVVSMIVGRVLVNTTIAAPIRTRTRSSLDRVASAGNGAMSSPSSGVSILESV